MPFVKALVPGLILTFIVCIVMGSNGSTGAWLDIHRIAVQDYTLYWSWPLFIAYTAISWGIFAMME